MSEAKGKYKKKPWNISPAHWMKKKMLLIYMKLFYMIRWIFFLVSIFLPNIFESGIHLAILLGDGQTVEKNICWNELIISLFKHNLYRLHMLNFLIIIGIINVIANTCSNCLFIFIIFCIIYKYNVYNSVGWHTFLWAY